jgi:hypothetical protein
MRQANQVRLNVERLEGRQLMAAGNVTAVVESGDLVIRAADPGNFAESFKVRQVANDQFTVEGFNGTKVNGATTRTFSGVFDDVRIYTYGGADNVQVLGTSTGPNLRIVDNLQIDSGSGNDTITVKYAEVGTDVKIDTGAGVDTTKLLAVRAGDDVIVEDYSTYQSGDKDIVYAEFCQAGYSTDNGYLKFDLNDGNDRVYLHSVRADYLTALLYGGDDYFSMVHSKIENLGSAEINGGDGSDGVNLFDNQRLAYSPGGSGIQGFYYWTAADPLLVNTRTPSRLDSGTFL